jgi:hypothetical protein
MRYIPILSIAALSLSALPSLAQVPANPPTVSDARPGHVVGIGDSLPRSNAASNIVSSDTQSNIAPTLPPSALGENGAIHDYLRAARAALVAGHTGAAQQSLEMAETRALDRSVRRDQVNTPSNDHFIVRISDARRALGNGDTPRAIQLIDQALAG